MGNQLTLMAVHAHPDDEASSTGGVLASYAAQGVTTVVVTCTNGEFGDAAGGVKPGQDGHDEAEVAAQRLAELRKSAEILNISHLEPLGYHDSGMPDWEYHSRPDAFCNVPLPDVAARIGALIEKYRPQVLISYDDQGPYQHPDHLHASQATQLAFANSVATSGAGDGQGPAKLYLSAMRPSSFMKVWEALAALGEQVPDFDADPEAARRAMESEARITTSIDITAVLARKRDALFAHGSQIAESWFSKIPRDVLAEAFGHETFIRAADRTSAPAPASPERPETDLFAGLRTAAAMGDG